VFTVIINRRGADAAATAALAAAGLSLVLLVKDVRHSGIKIIDVTGVMTFAALAGLALTGPSHTDAIADYGRGSAAAVLALVMLLSAVTVPFTEQYARETVSRQYWSTPEFRSVNRRISALWGGVVAIMAIGHLIAGYVDPVSQPATGARPVDLVLNWAVPVALVMFAIKRTELLSDTGSSPSDTNPATASPVPHHGQTTR
jgi:hypothetical protein